MNKKVLMITYVFPPAAWVGGLRTLKYCKYLGRDGWTPIVIAARPIGVTFQDESLLHQIPSSVLVHRTFDVDPAKWEEKLAARKLRRSKAAAAAPVDEHSLAYAQRTTVAPGLFRRAKQLVKSILKDSPDSHIFWVPFAFFRGVAILRKEGVDVIYCTSPPHSSHFAAYLLAKLFRKPYVLDFRDPWYVSGSVRSPDNKIPALLKLETRAKRTVVRGAARVICASRGERDELRVEFPDVEANRFVSITNGYDPSDFEVAKPASRGSNRLILTHAGTIYSGAAGELFAALQRLAKERPELTGRLQVQLLGEIAHEYAETIRELESKGLVRALGMRPHAVALQALMESDVLIVLLGGSMFLPSEIPTKVYEYLHAGKPILAIAAEGEATHILRQSGLGIVVPPMEVEKLIEELGNLVADHAAGRLRRVPNQSYIRTFERAALAEQLAHVLDTVRESELARPQCSSR